MIITILQRWQAAVLFNSVTLRPQGKTIGSQHAFRVPKVGILDILRTDMSWLRSEKISSSMGRCLLLLTSFDYALYDMIENCKLHVTVI